MIERIPLIDRLWRRPQGLLLRRMLFQIHLWSGIAVGLYLLIISVSGSLLVFRTELHRVFARPPITVAVVGERLTEDQLKEAALKVFPKHTVTNVWPTKQPELGVEVWLSPDAGGNAVHHVFDPYTGKDLGSPDPPGQRFLMWLVSLHDDLLFGEEGRKWNGWGAVALTLLCLTGIVIWWPGIANYRRSLTIDLKSNWKLFNWNMHNALGFWSFLLVFMWALSGVYLAFPGPFQDVVDRFEPFEELQPNQARVGDEVLQWITRLHFGRFAGWKMKALWTVLGLVPMILFLTGAVMWWNRVLRPAALSLRERAEREAIG